MTMDTTFGNNDFRFEEKKNKNLFVLFFAPVTAFFLRHTHTHTHIVLVVGPSRNFQGESY